MSLCLDLRLFFDDDVTKKLLFETAACHSEVDKRDLDADFGRVVWVRHLGCHEQFECLAIGIRFFLVEFDLQGSVLILELLVEKDGVNGWINVLMNVLD